MNKELKSARWIEWVRNGIPLNQVGVRVIDAHAHLGGYFNFYIPRPDATTMVAQMDRLGIEKACISSIPACGADVPRGNEMTAAAVRDHPGRFVGYASVDPHHPERVYLELQRSFDELGLSLIKLHPTIVDYPIDGPAYEDVWRFASERRAIVLSHTWAGTSTCAPRQFEPLARNYPDVAFLFGHSGGVPAGYVESIDLANRYPNIYLDLCRSEMSADWVERIVTEVGADRVFWGTDFPFLEPRYLIGRLACSKLSDQAKRQVFGGSVAALLKDRKETKKSK